MSVPGWSAACLGLVAGVTVCDYALGPEVNFAGILAVPPFMASALLGPRRTALVGVLALVCAAALSTAGAVAGVEAGFRVGAVLVSSLLAVQVSRVREHRERR